MPVTLRGGGASQGASPEANPIPLDGMTLPHCAKGMGVVTAETGLRCREGYPDGPVLAVWSPGKKLTVWAIENDWWLVQDEASGLAGWSFGGAGTYLQAIGKLEP